MASLADMKRTRAPAEEDQKSLRMNSTFIENNESLTETAKRSKQYERLAERVELLEDLVKNISATEGKTYRVNSVLHLQLCIKEQQI